MYRYSPEPAIDPPDVYFEHWSDCENQRLWQCKSPHCTELIPDTELNWCENCLVFIPRISECVCDELDVRFRDSDPRIP